MIRSTLLAGAALGLCAPCFAQSSVTLTGTIDLAARQVRNGRLGSISSMVSGANSTSKLVLQGQEDLGDGLSAGFFLDSTILADTGATNTPFWDRRSTVSLGQDRLGELRMGRDWAPTHLIWTAIDPFITLGIAGANTFRSTLTSRALGQAFGATADATAQNPTLRIANVVEYFLPSRLGGVYGSLIASAGEGGTAATGSTRGDGIRLGWANQTVNVGFAQFNTRNANNNRDFIDQVWGASYAFGTARVSVGQRRWTYGSDRTTNTLLGLVIPTGRGAVKLTYLAADQSGATAALNANDAKLFGAGYDYYFSKLTVAYGHVARLSNQGAAAFAISGGPATSGVAAAANYFGGQASTAFELGIRHDF